MANVNAIEFDNVDKWYQDYQTLKSINLSVRAGEIPVVCEPSGSRK
ncbi:hypothetical protein [Vibrio proteolyticus]|uniref:ABC transporter ATP-binding protein n=1 Tax=Vibrio proteolyticus NBRC 13287 TaxID=1219065 RepID=U2ZKC7_VIBPR|nr:hypothetical protein VPR01S_12_00200 [Vibrio proteolyticus NBRC 13287]